MPITNVVPRVLRAACAAWLLPQVMFAHLALGRSSCYNPRDFWRSFKDYDGQPVDIKEHQDAYEFFTRLQVRGVEIPWTSKYRILCKYRILWGMISLSH